MTNMKTLLESLRSLKLPDFSEAIDDLEKLHKNILKHENTAKEAGRFQKRELHQAINLLKEQRRQMVSELKRLQTEQINAIKNGVDNTEEISRQASALRETTKNVAESSTETVREIERVHKSMAQAMEDYEQFSKQRAESIKKLGETGVKIQEDILGKVEKVADVFKSQISQLKDIPEGLFGGLSSFVNKKAGEKRAQADKVGVDTETGMALIKSAASLAQVGKTLLAVGGSLAAVVGLFSMMEGAVQDANKEILKSVSYTDLLDINASDVQDSFKQIRETFTDASFSNQLGMSNSEVLELAGTLNKANFGFKAFSNGLSGMKDAMTTLRAESLRMGVEMSDLVTRAEMFAYEIGVSVQDGAAFRNMASDLADIRDMAVQTGYSTSNFFKIVTDLTSQLDNMNLRTKEAGAMFIRLGRIVGPNGVQQFLSGLAGGITNESYLDQIKRQMLTSGKEVSSVLQAEALRSSSALLSTFEDSEGLRALSGMGIDTSSKEGLIKSLQGMDVNKRQEVLGKLSMNEQTAGLGRELSKVMNLARGADPNASRTDKSRAFDAVGAGGALGLQYARAETHLRGRNVSELSDIAKDEMIQFTGLTKEQIEQYGQIQDTLKGQYVEAQKIAEASKNRALTEAEKNQLDTMGLKAQGGKLRTSNTDIGVGDFTSFLTLAQGEALSKKGEEALTQEDLLQQNVIATVSVADRINNYLGEFLQTIATGVMDIANHLFFDDENDATIENKKEAITKVETDLAKIREGQANSRKEIAALEMKAKVAKGDDKKAIEAQLEREKEKLKEAEDASMVLRESRRQMQQNKYGMGTIYDSDVSQEDIEKEAREQALYKIADRGQGQLKSEVGKKGVGLLRDVTLARRVNEDYDKEVAKSTGYVSTDGLMEERKEALKMAGFNEHGVHESGYVDDGTQSVFAKVLDAVENLLKDPSELEKEAVAQEKKKTKDPTVQQAKKKEADYQAEAMVKAQQRAQLNLLAEELGISSPDAKDQAELKSLVNQKASEEGGFEALGYSNEFLRAAGLPVKQVQDLYLRGGQAYALDSKDDVLALKNKGAIDQVLNGASSGSPVFHATFNIMGGGREVANEVVTQLDQWVKKTRGGTR
jgi:hypothetical protein